MADETIYRDKYTQIMEVPAPDDLINGWYTSSNVKLTGECSLKRGTLLMSSGNNEFVPATNAGLESASEIAILCDDTELPAGESGLKAAYFSGDFLGTRIILPYETEEDNHAELIDAIRVALRKHSIMVK